MKQSHFSSTLISVPLILVVFLFVFFLYTFLHEAGHAVAGLLFGQSITEFDVSFWDLSAHVGTAGGELSSTQLAIRSAAGASLPLLIWAIFIGLVARKTNFTLEVLKLLSSMTVINTLLVWMALPIFFLANKAPADDVTNVLLYSRMPPLLLVVIALVLYISGWNLFLSKIDGCRNELLLFRTTDRGQILAGARSLLLRMTGVLAICVLAAFLLNSFADSSNRFSPPQGFDSLAQIDLSRQAYEAEALAEFTLDQPRTVGVFVVVRNINTTYFDLSVTGPDTFQDPVLHGEGYNAFQDGGLWQKTLPSGTYRVVLTSDLSAGTASVYLKIY
jgi:hypothetical protein